MNLTPATEPNFFGKDHSVLAVGFIEDVDDPKRSGRVKVRWVGWHPKDKKGEEGGLPTEQLPWAKCLSQTQNQARVGAKHSYLPGACVLGLFFDGYDANDAVVLGALPFTAKVNEKNDRVEADVSKGKVEEDTPAFTPLEIKTESNGETNTRNSGTVTVNEAQGGDEPADIARHQPLNDAKEDGQCPIPESQASKNKESERKRGQQGNPEGQERDIDIGDGICGSVQGAQQKIQSIMKDMFPAELNRFVSGDEVWSTITGQHMNINGIFKKISGEIASLLKGQITMKKGFMENMMNRTMMSSTVNAPPDRDGVIREALDFAMSGAQDAWHTTFTQLLDQLEEQVMGSLQQLNDQQDAGKGQNNSSDTGSNTSTPINNPGDISITNAIIKDCDIAFDKAKEKADAEVEEKLTAETKRILDIAEKIEDTIPDDFECEDDYVEEINKMTEELTESASSGGGGGGGGGGGIESMLQQLTQVKYAMPGPAQMIFNKSGPMSLVTQLFSDGCKDEKLFNTESGKQSSSSSSSSSDSEDKSSSDPLPDTVKEEPKEKGTNGKAMTISMPSSDKPSAENFKAGRPTDVIVSRPGKNYYGSFPTIYIDGYMGSPVPVVEPRTGEMVAILTNPLSFGENPYPAVTIAPDTSSLGINSRDEDYNIILGGFFIHNTGFRYTKEMEILVIDKDTEAENGKVKPVLKDGRLVRVDIINTGSGFKRLPRIIISDPTGFKAKVTPIMSVINKSVDKPQAKIIQDSVKMVYCGSKTQKNGAL